MIRPRTGQRKLGRLPAGSADFTGSVATAGAVGTAMRAALGESALARLPVGGVTGATARGATGERAASRISGMTMCSPTFTLVSGAILLALAMTITGLP
jgi:hypothetical protein